MFERKEFFYDELKDGWDMHSAGDLVMCWCIDGFDGVHGGYGVSPRIMEGRMLLEICLEKELCVSNTWFKREEKRKVLFRMGGNETEINVV